MQVEPDRAEPRSPQRHARPDDREADGCGRGAAQKNDPPHPTPLEKSPGLTAVIHTNLDSFYNVLKPLVMGMASRKNKRGGRIITMSSVSGVYGNRGQTNYSASKAGIIGASKALAVELAGRGITVNVIAPGVIDTEMTKAIDPEIYDMIMSTIPMKRAGKPEEIGALSTFLLSDAAGYITRQVITVNGGMQ